MNKICKTIPNPFYVILVLAGIAFCITACAYGVMAVKQLHQSTVLLTSDSANLDAPFVELMDKYGPSLMALELTILGLATFLAMATDNFWSQLVGAVTPPKK